MFVKLNEIRWENYSHSYGKASDIPALLIALQTHERKEFEETFHDFWNKVHHQGDINPVIPQVVPFLLELLAEPDYPHKDAIVTFLHSLCDWGATFIKILSNARDFSSYFYDCLATLNAIEAGQNIYLKVLREVDWQTAVSVLWILQYLNKDKNALRVALRRRIKQEKNSFARAEMLWLLGLYAAEIHEYRQKRLYNAYQDYFNERSQKASSRGEKIAAAAAWAHIYTNSTRRWSRDKALPVHIPVLILDGLAKPYRVLKPFEKSLLEHDKLFRCLGNLGRYTLIDSLKYSKLSPELARQLFEQVMEQVFGEELGKLKKRLEAYQIDEDGLYLASRTPVRFDNDMQFYAIQVIIEADILWKIQTGLFFPEKRELLKKLLGQAREQQNERLTKWRESHKQ